MTGSTTTPSGRVGARTLGTTAPLTVSALGPGCMGMSEFEGTSDEQFGRRDHPPRARSRRAFLDTADM